MAGPNTPLDYGNPGGTMQRGANDMTNLGNSAAGAVVPAIMELLQKLGIINPPAAPQQAYTTGQMEAPPAMVASPEMMQGQAGAQPLPNPSLKKRFTETK